MKNAELLKMEEASAKGQALHEAAHGEAVGEYVDERRRGRHDEGGLTWMPIQGIGSPPKN